MFSGYNGTFPTPPKSHILASSHSTNILGIGLGIGLPLFFILVGIFAFLLWKRRRLTADEFNVPMQGKFITRVKVKNRIGGGNFGDVYRGEWQGTDVALKKLKSQTMMEQFKEAVVLHKLTHPNIVQVREAIIASNDVVFGYICGFR